MVTNQVSIIGSGTASRKERKNAREVGKLLAKRNVTVVCGGKGGVMKAAAEGVQSVKPGKIIGIRPEARVDEPSPKFDHLILTGIGAARNLAVVLSGRTVIAVGGNFGTLSELAYARKFDKPIFGVGTWEHPRFEFESHLTPREAVERALE